MSAKLKATLLLALLVTVGCGKVPLPEDPRMGLVRLLEPLMGRPRAEVLKALGTPNVETFATEAQQTVLTYRLSDHDVEVLLNYREQVQSYLIDHYGNAK